MLFRMDCKEVDIGPQHASFEFFKPVLSGGQDSALVHTIDIDPSTSSIWWTEQEFNPVSTPWHSIDLAQLKISADDTLQIAEANGGSKVRPEINNKCATYIQLAPDGEFRGWDVQYFSYDHPGIDPLNVYIEEHTGAYETVYPKLK